MSFEQKYIGLKNKNVVITGACGQLGYALTQGFIDVGAAVIGLDINIEKKHPHGNDYLVCDVAKKKEVEEALNTIADRYGKIDVLINNAGVSTFEPFEERDDEKFSWVMDTNLKGTFNFIKSYVNLHDEHKWDGGCITNIGSLYGVVSPDFRIYTDCDRKSAEVYGATKAGVIQMTRYFGVHLAERNIRVNAISPGGILNAENPQGEDFRKNYSHRCPMGRMANVDELIGAAIYLSSKSASYTTGHNLVVDGAMSCW